MDTPGENSPGDSGGEPSAPYRSLRTSCNTCKRMKLKCKRQGHSCLRCVARGLKCETTFVVRKNHVREKRKTTMTDIEGRIKRLESVLTASGIDPEGDPSQSPLPQRSDTPSNLADQLSTLIIDAQGTPRFIGASSGFSLFSPQGLRWVSERTGNDDLAQFMIKLARADSHNFSPEHNDLLTSSSSATREPLPPKQVADVYIQCFFTTFNPYWPLFDPATFHRFYELQYSDNPPPSASWYACLNVVICIGGMLLEAHAKRRSKTAKNPSSSTQEQHWRYYRNACSCFMDLIFKDSNLMAVQALCAMTLIQQASFNPEPCYFLISSAGRLAYKIGLHRKLDDLGMSATEIETRRNVLWIVYCLDKSHALRVGQPSIIVDDDIGIDLPEDSPLHTGLVGTRIFNVFRHTVQLAQLESLTFSELYSIRSRNRPALERLRTVVQLDKALQEWRENLPMEISPGEEVQCSDEQYMAVILMHFTYLNCLTTIHRIAIHHSSWKDDPQSQLNSSVDNQRLTDQVEASEAICLTAARNTVELLQAFDMDDNSLPDGLLCMMLYHPLSGFLTLFANILHNPQSPHAPSDLQLMRLVTAFIAPFVTPASPAPLWASIRLLRKFEDVATKFVDQHQPAAGMYHGYSEFATPEFEPGYVNETQGQSLDTGYVTSMYQQPFPTNEVGNFTVPNNGFTPPDVGETPVFSESFDWGLANLLRQPEFGG